MKNVFRLVLIILVITSLFSNCNSQTSDPIITRDTTITPINAITTLELDSIGLDQFLIIKKLPDSTAKRVKDFYISRNYQYAWFNEDGLAEQARVFWNLQNYYLRLNKDSSLYDKALFERMDHFMTDSSFSLTEKDIPLTEMQLTRHFFEYAQYAYAGKIDPAELQWHIPRKKLNPTALLDSLVKNKGNNIVEWEPVNGSYLNLQEKLITYYGIEKSGGWDSLKISNALKFSNKDSSLINLKRRLFIEGDISTADSSIVFDSILVEGINNAKIRYGISPDGKIDNTLINALNVSVQDRIVQILVNMERMRWLPGQNSKDILVANIPDFTLRVFENNNVVLKMNIVVGKEGTSSVIFTDVLKYVVFAPYWNVPQSIVKNEIVPSMKRNKNYLKRQNMEITGYSNGFPIVRQKPGGNNALGLVKFIFPNSYNIYFHDTPSKSLFNRDKRAFSHGCIRLQQPFELAKYLLRKQPEWTDDKIKEAMNSGKEKWVSLTEPVPVLITYFTAWVDGDNLMHFNEDVYGYDKKLSERLFSK